MAQELGLALQRALLVDERAVVLQEQFRFHARLRNAIGLVEKGFLKDREEATKPIQDALDIVEARIMLFDEQIAEVDKKIEAANKQQKETPHA